MQLFANNASFVLAADISDSDTEITAATGQGVRVREVVAPDYLLLTIQDHPTAPTKIEVLKVTDHEDASDTFTVEREQEGIAGAAAAAFAFSAGAVVSARVTQGTMARYIERYNALLFYTTADALLAIGDEGEGLWHGGELAAPQNVKAKQVTARSDGLVFSTDDETSVADNDWEGAEAPIAADMFGAVVVRARTGGGLAMSAPTGANDPQDYPTEAAAIAAAQADIDAFNASGEDGPHLGHVVVGADGGGFAWGVDSLDIGDMEADSILFTRNTPLAKPDPL